MGTVITSVVDQRSFELEGWVVSLITYQIGDNFICQISNHRPGATLARISAPTQDDAEAQAVAKAARLLSRTTRRRVHT